jgi:drug/metabolite transporter (DMT)-like permease
MLLLPKKLKNHNKKLVYLSIIIAMICWSMSFIWYKQAYLNFGPFATVFLRLLISASILMSVAWLTGRLKIKREHYKLFLIAALFEPFLYFIGESIGMLSVSPVVASVIVATIPVFTPVVSSILYSERLNKANRIGIIVSFVGVLLVIVRKGAAIDASFQGIMLMFLAVLSAIAYALALRKLTPHYDSLTIVAIQNTIGMVLFLPLFIVFDSRTAIENLSFSALIPVIYLAIFASSIAFILFAYGVAKLGISKANAFTNLIPVITSLFSYFFLKEIFSSLKIAGIILVVGGLFLTQLKFTQKSKD